LLSSWFNFRSRNREPEYLPAVGPSGLYLWYAKQFALPDFRGDVGCGKTMLMDMLYDTLPATTNKTRVHFHAFMLDIHKSLPRYPPNSFLPPPFFSSADPYVDKHMQRNFETPKPIHFQS